MSGKSRKWMNFRTERHGEVYGSYQTIYDTVDALAAIAFIVGSVLFFKKSTEVAATWLFLIGSVFFAVRPLVHVARDFHLAKLPHHSGEAKGEEE
ncbi:YrhK family protein [Henriciella sp.]|uniref:YrhK family protein n=1 Tax=Henriciella sp. TaxID=1968823 RepID=UPI002635C263|nr:YrhK family protein [Henriciella sp.]